MDGPLAKESCEEGGFANVGVTMFIEIHLISYLVSRVSERSSYQ